VIERFIAALYDAERELDARLSPGVELAASGLKQMLDDVADSKGLVLMARVDGIAVGFGCVLVEDYRDPSYVEAVQRRAYVSYLYVAEEWRRKSIGGRLLHAMVVTRYKAVNVAAARCYEAADFGPDQHIVSKPIGD
jgi:GNAT superfamily N-acetyltransferase